MRNGGGNPAVFFVELAGTAQVPELRDAYAQALLFSVRKVPMRRSALSIFSRLLA